MVITSQSRSYSRRSAGILLLVGVLAGVTVGGGVGVIAASSTKSVTVCANKKTNVLRYAKNGNCTKTETKVVLNQAGADGTSGAAGAKGDTGAAGVGTKGDTGVAGAKGDTGDAGVGTKGDTGVAGAKGDTGDAGVGTKGDTGVAGAKGDTGTNGTNGANTNSQTKNICGVNGATACAVGLQGPGGGIVFMTPSTAGNTSGLFYEAAPSTWSSPSGGDPTKAWCDNSTGVLGVLSAVVSTGAMDGANKTAVMLGVCTSGAANLADEYSATVNGVVYGDWFLPSKGELNQMYDNQAAIGGFTPDYYWSSSETSCCGAWNQTFAYGGQFSNEKSYTFYVRPVRAF